MNTKTSSKQNKKFSFFDFLYNYGTLLTIVVIFAFFTIATDGRFMQAANLVNILRAMSITTVIATGVMISLVVGGFDLSVGSVASMTMAVSTAMFVWYDQNIFVAIAASVVIAAVIGYLNSILIIKGRIPDMLATLAAMFIFNGVSSTFSQGKIISQNMIMADGTTSTGLIAPMFRELGKVPTIIIIMVLIMVVVHIFLKYTKHGRYMYVVGGNKEAARLSGVKVNKYIIVAYVMSAILAGIGGILLAARIGQSNPSGGAGYLMESVAAAYIGFSVAGAGKPNAIGTFFGALLMVSLSNGLVMLSVPYYSMDIIKGAVLVLALGLTYYKNEA
ncbi:Methylthioribose transport system permease protein [Acetoanaerobium sticklandii]|uniref:Methylthioribose transport system permease protein n=1 Tax=Acetoanaerobium sticklandii (strain ATCC 12662 / DSM 519 / JCM 1433 / CCUG 9281 / NCIMB 10654 / HF) TaxID=499177 RepID=E3PWJ8_ACESD|nr:ABC transporter permease [Acetoanaerobium sticklandii]CBH20813.1 Methylthioribose transport system permease protein [Acetoanaerobium sticklandii]